MKKVILFIFLSVLSISLFACGQEEPYVIGEIEKVDKDKIILSVEENKSKIGETDRVILTHDGKFGFENYEKGQKVKVLVYDEGVRLSNPPQVSTIKIEVIK